MSHSHLSAKVSEQDIYSARLRACDANLGFSFLSYGLLSLVPVITPKVPTCATDKYWRLYVNPNFFGTLTADQGAMVLVHEVWHPLLEHAARAERFGITVTEHELWNVAADIEINQHDQIAKRLPGTPATFSLFQVPPNQIAEETFLELLKKIKNLKIQIPMPGSGSCGSCAHGCPEDYELPPPTGSGETPAPGQQRVPGVSETRGRIIAEEVAREIHEAARTRGDMPAGWARWADRTLKPQVDYRALLRQTIQGQIISKSGYQYPSYRKPNRRQHLNPGFLRPYYKDILPQVAMIIDTSGSMSDRMVGQALAEVDGVLKAVSSRAEISVYFTDAAAAQVQKVTCTKDLRPVGGGGTDMGAGFDAIEHNRKRNPGSEPSTIIVVTDCHTGWPPAPPPYASVIVVKVGTGETAPWARGGKHQTITLQIPEPPVERRR